MWADVLNNPKQGKCFREFRGYLMNIDMDYEDDIESKNTSDRIAGVVS